MWFGRNFDRWAYRFERLLGRLLDTHDGLSGPCYDLCACRGCWRGWTGVRFITRLKWRIQYILGQH